MASFGIDEFKSEINKRGGLAPQNRFNVFFTPPSQALINIDIGQILSSVARGSFNKNQLISDPRSISLLVESTSFPARALEPLKFTNTGKFDEKRVVKVEDTAVDFTFYVTNDYYINRMIYDWQDFIFDKKNQTARFHDTYTCDVVIQALDQEQNPTYGVRLLGAYPSAINAQQLSQSQTGEQKLTITMDYDTFEIEDSIASSLSAVRGQIPGGGLLG